MAHPVQQILQIFPRKGSFSCAIPVCKTVCLPPLFLVMQCTDKLHPPLLRRNLRPNRMKQAVNNCTGHELAKVGIRNLIPQHRNIADNQIDCGVAD